jgi:hypothetical protein
MGALLDLLVGEVQQSRRTFGGTMQWAGRCAIDVVKLEDRKLKERRSRKRSESMTPVCTAMRHDGVCRTIYDAAIQSASTDR